MEDKRKARRIQPLEGVIDIPSKRYAARIKPLTISAADIQNSKTLVHSRSTNNTIFREGDDLYTYVLPHKLVLTVDLHVRMIHEQDENEDIEIRKTNKTSTIEPFQVPLPLPPNSHLWQKYHEKLTTRSSMNYGVRRMMEPVRLLDDSPGIKIKIGRILPQDKDKSLLDPPNAVPYNAYNLRYNSMGYLYEDVWNVEETRPLIAKVLLFEDYKRLERERKKRLEEKQIIDELVAKDQQEKETLEQQSIESTSTSDNERKKELQQRAEEKRTQEEKEREEERALDLNDKIGTGDIERSTWTTRILSKYPVIKEMKERLHPLWRAVSFGHTYDIGRKEVKTVLTHELLINIIMQHMMFERLNRSKKALQEESGIEYKWIDVDQSLMHALLKEAVKKSEKFYDIVIADKIPPNILHKHRGAVQKELDEMLADFGLEDEGMYGSSNKLSKDINIWTETNSAKQNMIVESDPITKSQHFIAGTLNLLVERLTFTAPNRSEHDNENFVKAFLVTYMSFTTPDMLLTKLIQRFNVPRGTMLDLEYTTRRQQIQKSVLKVIRMWLSEHYSHFDPKLLVYLQTFLEDKVISENCKKDADQILEILNVKKYGREKSESLLVGKAPDPKIPSNIFHPNLSIIDIDEEEVARQMTLIEFEHFKSIEPQELLNQAWNKVKLRNRAPNVIKMIKRFNEISIWVASVICTPIIKQTRVTHMKRFITICQHLRKMNNFNTLKAVLNGLHNPAVNRLKLTKEGLSQDNRKTLNDMNTMITTGMTNYQMYRQTLQQLLKQNTPIIPYMGVHQLDLQLIDENTSDFMRSEDNVELINWSKRELIYDIISDIQKMQSRSYNFIPVHQIQKILINMNEIIENPKDLIQLSWQAEPPGGGTIK
jgi:son of sevenless-like protein